MMKTLGMRTAQWPFTDCPTCGQHDFIPEDRFGDVVFTCACCGQAWRHVLGHLVSVEPAASSSTAPGHRS
ncbi:MAG: hypothetical protein OEV40_00165 [Acidimicrobiia bacterium]|nr:hypothetical protein [Acidimicrobiia bacterium]